MQKLFNQIKNNYTNIDYNIQECPTPKLDSRFISKSLVNKIKKKMNHSFLVNFKNNRIIITNNKDHVDYQLFMKLVNAINLIKKIVGNSDPNNICIWLSDYKKRYPKKGEIIGSDNVNSGSCEIYNYKNGDIYIWRREEVRKVLIHELLHSLKIDYEISNSGHLDNKIKNDFNVNRDININEAYAESLATIINCMIIAIEKKKDYKYFKKLIEKEVNYSEGQVNRLLEFNGFNNLTELKRKKIDNKIFKQNSSIFSYYIMKTALINNLDEYNKFLRMQGLKFRKENQEKYYKFLVDSFYKLRKDISTKKYRGKFLRMTIN